MDINDDIFYCNCCEEDFDIHNNTVCLYVNEVLVLLELIEVEDTNLMKLQIVALDIMIQL